MINKIGVIVNGFGREKRIDGCKWFDNLKVITAIEYEAKVRDLDLKVVVDPDVIRTKVPMKHAFVVGKFYGVNNLFKDGNRLVSF